MKKNAVIKYCGAILPNWYGELAGGCRVME
jgi:hypothetical protein